MSATKIVRNKLAIFVSTLCAVLFVCLSGAVIQFITLLIAPLMIDPIHTDIIRFAYISGNSVLYGLLDTSQGLIVSPVLFVLTMPLICLIWSIVIGRLPHRGVSQHRSYLVRGVAFGAILTGLACALLIHLLANLFMEFSDFEVIPDRALDPITLTITAGLTGVLAGGASGLTTSIIHLMILKPKTQLQSDFNSSAEIFD